MSAGGGSFVGALQKIEQGSVGVRRLAHGFVRKDEFAEVLVEAARCRRDGIARVARRFRVGIAIEERLDAGRTRPEAAATDLMRVGIAGDAVGQVGHAGMLRRCAAREARACKIERSPKKMNGADFAAEAGAELCEYARRLKQNTPESLRKFGVVGMVNLVLVKTNRVLDFDGHGPDAHRQVEAIECGEDLMIEIRDRHWPERERAAGAVAGIDE